MRKIVEESRKNAAEGADSGRREPRRFGAGKNGTSGKGSKIISRPKGETWGFFLRHQDTNSR